MSDFTEKELKEKHKCFECGKTFTVKDILADLDRFGEYQIPAWIRGSLSIPVCPSCKGIRKAKLGLKRG